MPQGDKLPIMEHEVKMEPSSEEVHDQSFYAARLRRPTAFRMSIITLLLFIAALLFLFLLLVTPLMFSVNHPKDQHAPPASGHDDHGHSGGMDGHGQMQSGGMDGHGQMPNHEHSHNKRDVSGLTDKMRTNLESFCPCAARLRAEPFSPDMASQLKDCLNECFAKLPKKWNL